MKYPLCLTFCVLLFAGVVHAKIVYMIEGDIYVCEDNGTNRRALTKHTVGSDNHPRWSPDGTQIVFARRSDHYMQNTSELFIIDENGQNLQRLTNNDIFDRTPSWSPDGTRIIFVRSKKVNDGRPNHNNRQGEIHAMDLATRTVTQLTGFDESRGSVSADLSPDGTQIVFERFIRSGFTFSHKILYVMSANGEQHRPLFPIPDADADKITMMFQPKWSADGQRILYVDCTDQGLEQGGQTCHLTVLRIRGRTNVIDTIYDRLGNNLFVGGHCWMENDSAILFTARNKDNPYSTYDLYRYVFATRSLRRITKEARHELHPDWIEGPLSVSPQGRKKVTWGGLKE